MFQPSPVEREAYRAPSTEAWRLVRWARWLTSPERGEASLPARLGLRAVVAPMTQLTFVSFDLQAFLFLVFHRSPVSVVAHAVFMTTSNLSLMAALRGTGLTIHQRTIDGALVFSVVLLAWYGSVALAARLRGWLVVTAPLVAALYLASAPVAALCRDRLHTSPLWGVLGSAFLVALSHAFEADLPPRTVDPWRWVPLRTYLLAPDVGAGVRALRLVDLTLVLFMGTVSEAWASLRLMPYNWLLMMMRLGYAPTRRAELVDWRERAWATGNPALDYVGSGGGTFLAPPESRRSETIP